MPDRRELVMAARPVVDLRRWPDPRAERVTQLRLGDRARVLERRRGWLRVAGIHDRYPGWARSGGFASAGLTGAALRRSLVAHAMAFRGVGYLWGGTTPAGFDCSGFVQFVYRLHGVHLRRNAWQQAADPRWRPRARASVRPGDLLFFHPGGAPRARISHVGMAVSHARFIHATTRGRHVVQVSRIDEPHWQARRARIARLRG